MTFNPNIPQATDLISASQSQIQTNFSQSNTAFAVDHTAFDVVTNQGMHKQVTIQNVLGANPDKTSPIASIYTKASSVTSTSDLYYQDGNTSSNVKQLTGGGITAAAYCTFAGSTGALTANSYNIASVTRTGTGTYQIQFTRNFTNANYVAVCSAFMAAGGSVVAKLTNVSKAASQYLCGFQTQNNAFIDPTTVDVVFFGVLA